MDVARSTAASGPGRHAAPAASRFSVLARHLTAYARWLDSISWWRFLLVALLALIAASVLAKLPPFSTPWGRDRQVVEEPRTQAPDAAGRAPSTGREPAVVIEPAAPAGERAYRISIGTDGVKVEPVAEPASASASAPVRLTVPAGGLGEGELEAIRQALREAATAGAARAPPKVVTVRAFRLGDSLTQVTMLLVVLSAVVKAMAAGRFKAEARAVAATEKADAEALRRQVVEARMAAMQAQIEPHFLFNTLASIDHLIETDPPRASRMQKHLIALLRASMPGLRESAADGSGLRPLGRELDVVRPYLEILQVRMEDRLQASIDVPHGLESALFPPLVVQSLVENAIRHGLEPKPEGGSLRVQAQVVDGRLAVTVADTGLGLGRAATSGTGVGLTNIRDRLAMLYGPDATLDLAERPGGGAVATVTVPYRVRTTVDATPPPRAAAPT
jgi:signal transduction histidine kinase